MRSKDIINGPGCRTSIYLQGCHFHCKGCFNQSTWDFMGGKELTPEKIEAFIEASNKLQIRGISILGGEPLDQANELFYLIKTLKERVNKPIWLWTGYVLNDIPKSDIGKWLVLRVVDTVIDGQYDESLYDYNLKYRGSSNQRVLSSADIYKIYNEL